MTMHKAAAICGGFLLTAATWSGSVVPASAASTGTCTISTHIWTNSDDEIINDATAVCNKAKDVTVRTRLYYCTWYNGDGRDYEVIKSKTTPKSSSYKTKKVTVVSKAMYGRWYGEAYVFYTKGKVKYSKSDLQFASVGGRPSGSDC